MKNKILFLIAMFGLLFLQISCSNNKLITYKRIEKTDFLSRIIFDKQTVQFDKSNNTFVVINVQESWYKDLSKPVCNSDYYAVKGNFNGINPLKNGEIDCSNVIQFAEEQNLWNDIADKKEDFVNKKFIIQNGKLFFDEEEYILEAETKEHRIITKKLELYNKEVDKCSKFSFEKNQDAFNKSLLKIKDIKKEIQTLQQDSAWTILDSYTLDSLDYFLERLVALN